MPNNNNVKAIFTEIIDRRKLENPNVKNKYMHVSALVSKNGIISYGSNSYGIYNRKNIHSEVDCLSQYRGSNRKRVDLYIARTTWNNSRPCIECIKSIIYSVNKGNVKIGYIYYTLDENHYAKYRYNELINEEYHHYSGFQKMSKGIDIIDSYYSSDDDGDNNENLEKDKYIYSY